ncbi:MAG TPA: hypothetical protein VFQ35_05825 [Polyangiaceae bacterium]|nr:hypothetical protein [Polyangiaceae bacterium]
MIRANHPTWEKLVKGEVKHKFAAASASMLFFNLQSQYKRDPSKLPDLVGEAQKFFEKYEVSLETDIATLFK